MTAGETMEGMCYPAGNTTGLDQISGNFLITSVANATNVGDLVKRTYSVVNKGTVTVASVV